MIYPPIEMPIARCADCNTKLDDIHGDNETLCGACYAVRLDDPCPDCGAESGVECSWSCGSRVV